MYWLLLTTLLMPFALFSEIHTIESMKALPGLMEEFDPADTLLVFDIDNTLCMLDDPAFQWPNFAPRRAFFEEKLPEWSEELFLIMCNMMIGDVANLLIEEEAPAVVRSLQDRGYKAVALTATLTAPVFGLDWVEGSRAAELNELGYDFSAAFPMDAIIHFDGLDSYLGHWPTFYQGLLFANGNKKSAVLRDFLEVTGARPSRVVFVEDTRPNLVEMEEGLEGTGIQVLGVHYLGARHYPAEKITDQAFIGRWNEIEERARALVEQKTDLTAR